MTAKFRYISTLTYFQSKNHIKMNKLVLVLAIVATGAMMSCAGGKKGCNGSWYGNRNTQIEQPSTLSDMAIINNDNK